MTTTVTASPPKAPALPRLREELQLRRGRTLAEGGTEWLIYDPARHRYVQLDPHTFELLGIWNDHATAAALADAASTRFGWRPTEAELEALFAFIQENSLTADPPRQDWRVLAQRARSEDKGALAWLLHNYLFFKIPLVRPNAFLRRTLPLVAPLASTRSALLVGAIGLLGLYLVSRQWDAFLGTFQHFFSLEGALAFALTLAAIKTLHELGHAYTAVRMGCQVPTMGVAFMMLAPMLYTDVTDAWRLTSRRERLAIDAAGVTVEIALACIATALWSFLPDGVLRSLAFIVASAGWIMSLAINLNPFMRFDGYYMLSDVTGIDNLQPRSFALARWHLRRHLLGLDDPAPETFPALTQRWLIAYAWATWIYRLILFVGIALLVYVYFFKVLGIALFVLEIAVFIVRPVLAELGIWWRSRARIRHRPRLLRTIAALAVLIALVTLPLSTEIAIPAVVETKSLARLYAKRPALLREVRVKPGQSVAAGDVLFELDAPDIAQEIRLAQASLNLVRMRMARRTADDLDREQSLVLEREQTALVTKLAGLKSELTQLSVRAPFDGRIAEIDSDAHPGRFVTNREPLAVLVGTDGHVLRGYVAGEDLARLANEAQGRFVPDDASEPALPVTVEQIAYTGAAAIEIADLASPYGGRIAVLSDAKRQLVPVTAQYQVTMRTSASTDIPPRTIRGIAHVKGTPQSLLARMWRQTLKVLVRESGV